MGEYSFKGSKIDRKFSYLSLEKILALQQKEDAQQSKTAIVTKPFLSPGTVYQKENNTPSFLQPEVNVASEAGKAVGDLFRALMDPGEEDEALPHELLEKQRKRKQKKAAKGRKL